MPPSAYLGTGCVARAASVAARGNLSRSINGIAQEVAGSTLDSSIAERLAQGAMVGSAAA